MGYSWNWGVLFDSTGIGNETYFELDALGPRLAVFNRRHRLAYRAHAGHGVGHYAYAAQ